MASDNRPSRGGNREEEDPERNTGTKANMRKSAGAAGVARGGQGTDDDPERNTGTKANMRRSGSVQRGGGNSENDPERNQGTQARVKLPPGKGKPKRRGNDEGEAEAEGGENYNTGSAYESMQEDNDYQTGNDYQPLSEKDLEGDGLEALDADLGPGRTTNLPQSDESDDGDEDDDEGEDGHTNAGRPLKLEIIAGPDAGKKKKFKGVRMKVGRTAGVDLLLKDQSVSRIHFEMVVGDKGVLLRDLGSGNGTKVNGEKVAEKLLVHGDEIAIGKTKIRFVDELAAFQKAQEDAEQQKEADAKAEAEAKAAAEKPAEEKKEGEEKAEGEGGEEAAAASEAAEGEADEKSSATGTGTRKPVARRRQPEAPQGLVAKFKALPKQKQLIFGGGAGVGVFLLLLLLIAAATSKPPPPKEDPKKALAQARMQSARNAARDGKYEDAVREVEEAEKLFPGIDSTKLGNQARDELAIVRGLDAIRTLIGQQRFEDARTELARIPKGTVKAEDDKKVVEEELKAAEAKYKRGKVEELLATGEIDSAKQVFAELPDADQRELAPKIEAAVEELEKQQKDQANAERNRQAGAANAVKQRHEEEMAIAFAVVQRKFLGNEWDRAASECDRVIDSHPGDEEIRKKAKRLQSLIPSFGRYYEEGKKKFQQGSLALAAKPLTKAYQTLEQMDLGAGKLRDELSDMLSESSVVAAKDALLHEDLGNAALALRAALRLDPSNPKAKDLLNQVVGKAEDLYQEAYMLRDREPREAIRKFKIVVEVTPAGSATHDKAQNQINSMPP